MSTTITKPGIYTVEESTYHSGQNLSQTMGRSLSATAAKTLLANPARFLHERDHGRPPKDTFDFGTLAHNLILGAGDDRLVVVDAYDWRSKAAQQAKAEAHAHRKVVVNRATLLAASPLARAVRSHPLASDLFSGGKPEQSLYWLDADSGATCRGRVDYLRDDAIVDLKTTTYGGSDPDRFARDAAKWDYPLAAAHYQDGVEAITGKRLPFLWVVVEKAAPYLVRVFQLSDDDMDIGRERAQRARNLFAEYEANGYPAVGSEIEPFTLPAWYGWEDDDIEIEVA